VTVRNESPGQEVRTGLLVSASGKLPWRFPGGGNSNRPGGVEAVEIHLNRRTMMTGCVTCGAELHPERAERYDYCTRRECREQNAKPLTIAAVAVNKAADQFLVLDDRARRDLAAGRYQDQRKSASVTGDALPRRPRAPQAAPRTRARSSPTRPPRRSWTRSQEDLALIYSDRGMRPDEIAERLGVSRHLATQMILAGKQQVKR
jgi:hypothetical protein